MEYLTRFGYLFYLLNPKDNYYEKVEDVKDYHKEVIPFFVFTCFIEQVILILRRKPILRVADTLSNTVHVMLMDLAKIPFKGIEVVLYVWVWENYRIVELPWNSPLTWIACWIATDFAYYWMHRLMHVVNILWAIHEPHHTPEDMMLSSPLRNHVFLLCIHWFTSLPMAFAIPPTQYLVHFQISILYQFWLHSEVINKMPAFIEKYFTTPSHHRAHHGRNRRYIDKNFGGYLIIWDKLFNTFEPENPDDMPRFGTIKQTKSFNPLVIQTQHFKLMWEKFWEYEGIGNKLSVIFKGPGWAPGKPWSGNIEDVPDPVPKYEKYDPNLSIMFQAYLIVHGIFLIAAYQFFSWNLMILSKPAIWAIFAFIAYSCIAVGFMIDNSKYGPPLELLRCLAYFVVDKLIYMEIQSVQYFSPAGIFAFRTLFLGSCFLWGTVISFTTARHSNKKKAID